MKLRTAATVLGAFEANYESLVKHGMGHLPSWVNPQYEEGWRLAGSGFEKDALWAETVPLAISPSMGTCSPPTPVEANRLTIQQAKEGLAATFGVSVDKIEILVRG